LIYSVQYIRAVAAIAVVLFHFRPIFISAGGSPAVASMFDWGHGGVAIFFVIAGFIMVWVADRKPRTPGRFMADRAVRIYGSYLPVLLAFVAYKISVQDLYHWVPGDLDLWGSILLIGIDPRDLLIYPAWTLAYELFFYAMFALCLFWRPDRLIVSGASVVIILLLANAIGALPQGIATIVSNPVTGNFIIGVAVGIASRRLGAIGAQPAWLLTVSGLAMTGVGMFMGENGGPVSDLIFFGGGTGLLLIGLIPLERAGRIPKFEWGLTLGNASYAIYLIHAPLIYVLQTQPIAEYVAYNYGPNALVLGFMGTLLAISVVFFSFEDWLNRRAKRALDPLWQRRGSPAT
jgi:exopolysaccharide production protein ExoZ